jgi:hypothetical protein
MLLPGIGWLPWVGRGRVAGAGPVQAEDRGVVVEFGQVAVVDEVIDDGADDRSDGAAAGSGQQPR